MTTRHILARLGPVAVLLGIACYSAYGQNITTGDLTGTVKDATSAIVPGATVTLKNTDSGETRIEQTSSTGASPSGRQLPSI